MNWKTWLRTCQKDPSSPAYPACKNGFGALTGQDARALAAIAACWELYFSSDEDGGRAALEAVRALLPAIQPQCRLWARELIAFGGDWSHRDQLWPQVIEGTF